MRVNIDIEIWSRLHHHKNEIALSASWSPPFSFGLTIGEWSWHFGIGSDDSTKFYGIFLSYSTPSDQYGIARRGYFTVAVSTDWWWESS